APANVPRGQFGFSGGFGGGGGVNDDLVTWLRANCAPVARGLWSAATQRGGRMGPGQQLYDCAPAATAGRAQAR
ncbi:MAG: hypothetical protein QOG45_900, partial [Chloroflexota bacterium]|nr:hypothetical protein [Chloroflexota bacterium]